ncbi:MAG: metallophosphoesterase [Bacteroidaceae bacterium]|nr:metallophosphoesterase [Bacteroidaceae bacterium]
MKHFLYSLFFILYSLATAAQGEKPLLRMALISDIHNQNTMITDASNLRLRTAFLNTIDSMRREGGIDVLALEGDNMTGFTIPQTSWSRLRLMLAEAARKVFGEGTNYHPVIYVSGNHDFEPGNFDGVPKAYNSGDYYTYPMKGDVGTLRDSECFYEMAPNGTKADEPLLAAFHYVVHGFDIVGMNCGKYFFADAWDYQYSQESIDWVDQKLAQLTADCPNRTIIFLAHLPLPSSVGATNNKTLKKDVESSYNLERVLAKYPGVIYLYGHDHSSQANRSYYERTIRQRLTCYNTAGEVIAPYGEEVGAQPDGQSIFVSIQATKSRKFLGEDNNNMTVSTALHTYEIYPLANQANHCVIYTEGGSSDNSGVHHYLYCENGGRFSSNVNLTSSGRQYFYEVADTALRQGVLVSRPEVGKTYAIVAHSTDGKYYAISDNLLSSGSASQRVAGVEVDNPTTNLTMTFEADNIFWNLRSAAPVAHWENRVATFKNLANKKYLGIDSYNMTTTADPFPFSMSKSTRLAFSFGLKTTDTTAVYYVHCGSSGRYSKNPSLTKNSSLLFYEVDPNTMLGKRCMSPEPGKTYAIVGQASDNSGYYALTSNAYSAGTSDQRLSGTKSGNNYTQTFTSKNMMWEMSDYRPDAGTPSFMSAFVGSMRYNDIATNASPSEADALMTQALILELYADSVVLEVKNYGQTGNFYGAAVSPRIFNPLYRYVVRRPVIGSAFPDDLPDGITSLRDEETAAPRFYSVTGTEMPSGNSLPRGLYLTNRNRKFVKE